MKNQFPAAQDQHTAPARPELHLSGTRLRAALEALLQGCESLGGAERYVDALKLKSRLFTSALVEGDLDTLDADTVRTLAAFMATVRRRIVDELTPDGIERLRHALGLLLRDASDTTTTDQRIAAFCAQYPADRRHRWVRDLAGEVLHHVMPEQYPLMTRWVWDRHANTGALREMWYGDDVDGRTIAIDDGYQTFLVLREELSVYLTDNGFYKDIPWYVDLLLAQVYAEYICAQGGSYLRADFSSPEDPTEHTRRMLGLDGIKAGATRTRLNIIDGKVLDAHT